MITIEPITKDVADERGVFDWTIWESPVTTFDWSYNQEEHCYIVEGKVTVETPEGKVSFQVGDYVVFPQGLSCTWHVEEPVKKHYSFK